jgi:hypothetical protein
MCSRDQQQEAMSRLNDYDKDIFWEILRSNDTQFHVEVLKMKGQIVLRYHL